MLKKRARDFAEAVSIASAQVGLSAPKIADLIMADIFPGTCRIAADEGADTMLRVGVIAEVRRLITKLPEDDHQADMAHIDPSFQPLVSVLSRATYFVPELEQYVPIERLIQIPQYLDGARKYLRRHGEDTLVEAAKLDELYAAVTA